MLFERFVFLFLFYDFGHIVTEWMKIDYHRITLMGRQKAFFFSLFFINSFFFPTWNCKPNKKRKQKKFIKSDAIETFLICFKKICFTFPRSLFPLFDTTNLTLSISCEVCITRATSTTTTTTTNVWEKDKQKFFSYALRLNKSHASEIYLKRICLTVEWYVTQETTTLIEKREI